MIRNADDVWSLVEARRERYVELSDRVWETPELNYEENRSTAEHRAMLELEGFRVETGIAGLPTAVMGAAGEGVPVIAIRGNFHALAGLGPVDRRAEKRVLQPSGQRRSYGHTLPGPA